MKKVSKREELEAEASLNAKRYREMKRKKKVVGKKAVKKTVKRRKPAKKKAAVKKTVKRRKPAKKRR